MRALADVPIGVNTWDVDLGAVRARVLEHPWIAEVEVRRWLPDGLILAVRERRAIAVLTLNGTPQAVDRRARSTTAAR